MGIKALYTSVVERKNATPQMALTSNLFVSSNCNNRATRSVLGHQMSRCASRGQRDDGRSLTLECSLDSSNSHCVSRIHWSYDLQQLNKIA